MVTRRVEFRGWACRVEQARYGGTDRIALQLTAVEDRSPVAGTEGTARSAIATLHMPELFLAADEVVIKDYSENTGMLDLLVAAGVVSPPLRTVQSGFVTLFVCRCLL
jgi:hypothetical protein